MKNSVLAGLFLISHIGLANHVWVEQDQRGQDYRVHITITSQADVQAFRNAFPNGFSMDSISPMNQSIEVTCEDTRCEIVYWDEHQSYRQNLDAALRSFELNRDIAIAFYSAFNIAPTIEQCNGYYGTCIHVERKDLSTRYDNDLHRYFRPRMSFRCNRTMDLQNRYREPFCELIYSVVDMVAPIVG